MKKIRVWDLPLRAFHWLLVIAVVALVVTSEIGGNAIEWHFKIGYFVLALLFFRIVWGFVGGYWARFSQIFYAPSTIVAYLKGQDKPEYHAGHNPLGSLSVWALLLLLILQVTSGLFSDDEIAFIGPLAQFVSSTAIQKLTHYHKEVGKTILIVLVILHVAAIAYYKLKKNNNLITPMLNGDKSLPDDLPASKDNIFTRMLALVILGIGLGIAYYVNQL